MLLFVEKVFEGFVTGTDIIYTDAIWDDLLGCADRLTVTAFVEQVSGTSPTISVASQHSNDELNWALVNPFSSIEISIGLTPGQNGFGMGWTDPTNSLGAFVRYEFALGDSAGSTPRAHVRLIACGRGSYPVDVRVPISAVP